jgi:ABC-2 type transport system permease protein
MPISDSDMKRYFLIYRRLLILNYHRMLIHRADFLTGLMSSILWGVFSIVAMYILTSRSNFVFGWSRTDLFVLVGVFNILIGGTYRTFFARNFDRFTHIIQQGELDGLLLKPFNTQFALSFWYISYYGFVRVLLAVIYTLFVLTVAHIPVTLVSIVSFFIFGFFGLMIIYSFWYLILTCIIWFPDLYNLVELLYATDNISRYPPQLLGAMKFAPFLLLFPITLIVSVPTKALLHTVTLSDILSLVGIALGLLYLSKVFWNFALRYYTSASG